MTNNREKTPHKNANHKGQIQVHKSKTTNITATYKPNAVSSVHQLTFPVQSLEKSAKLREISFMEIGDFLKMSTLCTSN